MNSTKPTQIPATSRATPPIPRIQAVIDECLPLLRALGRGRVAVTIGGSHGKGTYDERSDVDFRVFCDEVVGAPRFWESEAWKPFACAVDSWRERGIDIDYCWVRSVLEIDELLDAWLAGNGRPVHQEWSIWGYHLLTDLANQLVIDDPEGLVAAWQARLADYPHALQTALIRKHLGSLRYWRKDHHYRKKVARGDVVFLAGLSARLVHDILQVLFAINRTYYVGDGNNLGYATAFALQPADLAARLTTALYPGPGDDAFSRQSATLAALIDDLEPLVASTLAAQKAGIVT